MTGDPLDAFGREKRWYSARHSCAAGPATGDDA